MKIGKFIEKERNIGWVVPRRNQIILQRMIVLGVIDIVFTFIYSFILVKTNIYKIPNDILLFTFIFVIPLIICYFKVAESITIVW